MRKLAFLVLLSFLATPVMGCDALKNLSGDDDSKKKKKSDDDDDDDDDKKKKKKASKDDDDDDDDSKKKKKKKSDSSKVSLNERATKAFDKMGYTIDTDTKETWAGAPYQEWVIDHKSKESAWVTVYDFSKDGLLGEEYPKGFALTDKHVVAVEVWDEGALKEARKIASDISDSKPKGIRASAKGIEDAGWKVEDTELSPETELLAGVRYHLLFGAKGSDNMTVHILDYYETAAGKVNADVHIEGKSLLIVAMILDEAPRSEAKALIKEIIDG